MARIKRFFKRIFGKGKSGAELPKVKPPTETIPENSTTPKTGLKIALVRGHGGNDSGATGNGTSEVQYNTFVMDYIASKTTRNLKCFKANSSIDAVLNSRSFAPDVTIQLHLNAFDGSAKGCEVLVIEGDTKSYPVAEKFAKDFTTQFNRTLRRAGTKGKKILSSGDRGAGSLYATKKGIKILVEPFFIDSKSDFLSKEEYAEFLLNFTEKL